MKHILGHSGPMGMQLHSVRTLGGLEMFHHKLGILDTPKLVHIQAVRQIDLLELAVGPFIQVHIKGDGVYHPFTGGQAN